MNDSDVWISDSEWMRKEVGAEITKRKIRKLAFLHNGKLMVAEEGKPNPYNAYPIRKIYEDASRGCFYLCGANITIAPKDSLVEDF